MYRLNSLNADIQLIVDGAWASNSGIFVGFPRKHFGIFVGFHQKHLRNPGQSTIFAFVIR